MAVPTFLEIVNNVLTRLREATVSSVNDTEYSRLLKIIINDSKREIENANDWSALRTNLTVTTASGVDTYTLTGSGRNFQVRDVYNVTDKSVMGEGDSNEFARNNILGSASNGTPAEYTFKGIDPLTGDSLVQVYPTPDGVYSLRFEVVQRQDDLAVDADTPKVHGYLIELLAYAKAIAERGEDGGNMSNQVYQQFLFNLGDAIAIEKGRFSAETQWEVV